jgi:WD40 repeat protein
VLAQDTNSGGPKSADEPLPKGLRRLNVGYPVAGLAISPDSSLLATCGRAPLRAVEFPDRSPRIVLWDLSKFLTVHVLDGSKDCLSVAFSPDGKLVAGGRKDRGARVWNVQTGLDTNTLSDKTVVQGDQRVESIQFTADSKKVVYGGHWRARVFDLETEQLLWGFDDERGRASKIAIKPHSSIVATAGQDEGILLFDIESGKFVREIKFEIKTELKGTAKYVWQIAYSPNGEYLACVDKNSTVWLFDTHRYHGTPVWNNELCRAFAFSPDSKRIALAGKTIQLFDVASHELVHTFPGGPRLVFSPDGKTLVSTGAHLNIWDLRTVLEANRSD